MNKRVGTNKSPTWNNLKDYDLLQYIFSLRSKAGELALAVAGLESL